MYLNLLEQVYAASNSGLDIILDVCPQAADVVGSGRNFKLRPEERTPSAHLYPPKDGGDYWRVVDYGGGEGERSFSPIDLYMRSRGYTRQDFSMALHELAEKYGVSERLSSGVNKPEITRREASDEELGQPPRVVCREGFTQEELAVWGPHVKAEHLTELGWQAVDSVAITKGSEVILKKATRTYPIFVQKCPYQDEGGLTQSFQKLYEPKNPNKAFRFSIVGKKPRDYVFGLPALRKRFAEAGEVKLSEVVMVSGGSDAVNCLSMGYQPVWLGSETEDLTEKDFATLLKYASRVVNIPDFDETGVKAGCRQALRLDQMYTSWFTNADFGGLSDNRGRRCKDLRDFLRLHPQRKAMEQLMARAVKARFWSERKEKDGATSYSISRTELGYFLGLNGFFTLKDDTQSDLVYIRIQGIRVSRIPAKAIEAYLTEWMSRQGLPTALRDKVLRSRDLPTKSSSALRERNDLDFTKATSTEQRFYFRNGWVRVTKDGSEFHSYSDTDGHYVWEESIIPYDYRPFGPMFRVERRDDGGFSYCRTENAPSNVLRFVENASRLYWRKKDELGEELTESEIAEEHQCTVGKLAALGYMLHGDKSESSAWAVLCQDSTPSEDDNDCNGRSGKSFFLKAPSELCNTFPIEARVPSIVDNRFLFDGVTENTDIVIIDECCKNLNFDYFFPKISGDFRYEEKGNHPRLIPFSASPKFSFATNYVMRRHDPSTEGRFWSQVFSDYYHVQAKNNDYRETRTIRDDFGRNLLGKDYPDADRQADIGFLLQCLQFYLSLPVEERRIMPPMQRIERREQMAAVGKDFRQWADEYFAEGSGNLDCDLKCNEVLASFNSETHFGWSPTKLTQRLKVYCELAEHIQCFCPASRSGHKEDGKPWTKSENGTKVRCYYVQSVTKAEEHPPQVAEQLQLPF